MHISWKTLTEELIAANPWWKYFKDTFVTRTGYTGEYHYVHTGGSVMIIPVHSDGSVQLVRQYRYLHQRPSLEFPGGGIKDGATPEEMAAIELREETGFGASSLKYAGYFNPYNGVTDELCHIFHAEGLTHIGAEPEETEEIELVRLSVDEFQRLIAAGEIWDGMTLAAWLRFTAGKTL